MIVAFIGDTHANLSRMRRILGKLHNDGITTAIQVGDFGYWPNDRVGRRFLKETSEGLASKGITLHWVDGNHEDHQSLPHDSEEEVELYPNIIWHPRGSTSEMGGRRILWMGGAVSVDKPHRTPWLDWFPTEVPNFVQWDRAMAQGWVDIIVAHDAPLEAELKGGFPEHMIRPDLLQAGHQMRKGLSELVEATTPALYVHGHWHRRATTHVENGLRIEGLGHDMVGVDLQVMYEDLDLVIPRIDPRG